MTTVVKTRAKSIPLLLAAGLCIQACLGLSGTAQAAEQPEYATKTVFYGDLNLDSDQGAKVLYSRLRGAARDVCMPLESRYLLGNLWWRCFNGALESAVIRVNTARVTALHNRTSNHSAKS